MASPFEKVTRVLKPAILVVVTFSSVNGCVDSRETVEPNSPYSPNSYLAATDLDKFQLGRLRTDLLEDIQWRASSARAGVCNGKPVMAIDYTLISDGPKRHVGKSLHAMFVDDRFEKFIRWLPGERDVVLVNGTPGPRPKRTKVGDCGWLSSAMNSDAVSVADLKDEVKMITPPPPDKIDDPIFAAVVSAAYAIARLRGDLRPATDADYRRNAELRDQFNAARLSIGMTEAEVAAVLKAKPLESGVVEAGRYSIYGSNETFGVSMWVYFSNILVVFREGKVVWLTTLGAGENWRERLAKTGLIDLPPPPGR